MSAARNSPKSAEPMGRASHALSQDEERLLREAGILVHIGGVRSDFLLRQRPNRRPQLLVFLGKLEQIEVGGSGPSSHLEIS